MGGVCMMPRGLAFDSWRRIRAIAAALLFTIGAQTAFARTILFVGNSFTFGDLSPVKRFHPERVTDLNKLGFGGVPALFKTFTTEAGLDYDVSLETSPGKSLSWHYANEQAQLTGKWDVVTLQGYSTLDAKNPGDPADQIYKPTGHWYGKSIYQMAEDLAAANAEAVKGFPDIAGVIPVGLAWNRAM